MANTTKRGRPHVPAASRAKMRAITLTDDRAEYAASVAPNGKISTGIRILIDEDRKRKKLGSGSV